MSEICETVKVKDANAPGGHVVINKEDYDENVHALAEDKPVESMTKAELLDEAAARGVEVSASATKADIVAAIQS